jgi:hypothetical protein
MSELCKREDVKIWMNVKAENTATDALVDRLIKAVSGDFLRAIDRDFLAVDDYRDVISITPQPRGMAYKQMVTVGLRHWPVREISAVYVNGQATPESDGWSRDGWYFDEKNEDESRNSILLIDTIGKCRGGASIVVEYSAGYETVPADIEQAVIEWVGYRYTSRNFIGQSAHHTAQGESVTYQNVDAPETTKAVIERYKRSMDLL